MLSAVNRMRASSDFALAVRRGRRSGNNLVVVHSYTDIGDGTFEADLSTKVGFVVAKKVGNSVVRHTVSRKLRHVMRELLPDIRAALVVVRANEAAKDATSKQLRRAILDGLKKTGSLREASATNDDNQTPQR